jgi:hypothetical protein
VIGRNAAEPEVWRLVNDDDVDDDAGDDAVVDVGGGCADDEQGMEAADDDDCVCDDVGERRPNELEVLRFQSLRE